MPQIQQIAGGLQRAMEMVYLHAAALRTEVAVQRHHRQMLVGQSIQHLRVLALARPQHQPIDAAPAEQFDQGFLAPRVVVGIGQQQGKATQLQARFDRGDDAGVERIGEVRHQQSDNAGRAGAHALRNRIGLVAQALRRLTDRGDCRRADVAAAVERARGGSQRYTSGLRHVAYRCPGLFHHAGTAA